MKRPMLGGAHRGPVALDRQRRTIRLVQIILVLVGVGLIVSAGYSFMHVVGYEAPSGSASFERPRPPSLVEPVVLAILGAVSMAVAASLGLGRTVKLPTPARPEEFVGRAEGAAIERAELTAQESRAELSQT